MANYIILFLCLIIILAYFFDVTSKYSKIPSVILLIILGIVTRILVENTGLGIPDIEPILPVIGTLGLILIVLEASLDIKLDKKKIRLITRSVFSAIVLFVFFVANRRLRIIKGAMSTLVWTCDMDKKTCPRQAWAWHLL